jgi:hypothetical protein
VRAVFFPSVHPVPFKLRPEAALGRTQKALVAAQKAALGRTYINYSESHETCPSLDDRVCVFLFSPLVPSSFCFLLFALGSARRLNLAVIRRVGGCSATLAVCRLVGAAHTVSTHLTTCRLLCSQMTSTRDPATHRTHPFPARVQERPSTTRHSLSPDRR